MAQFYKDVEMAEVMTDNDHAVAKILESYEIAETEEGENEFQNAIPEGQVTDREETSEYHSGQKVAWELAKKSEVADMVKSKSSKKSAKKGTRLKKDVLTEIKNGRVVKNE